MEEGIKDFPVGRYHRRFDSGLPEALDPGLMSVR